MLRLSLVRRGLLAGALLAAGGGALALGVPSVAGATPSATKIVGGGGTAVTVGHPKTLAAAAVTPSDVAYTSTSGNIALISGDRVYLIPGALEANEFHIATAPSTYGTLTPADVYLVAGDGTAFIVGNPGSTHSTGSSSAVATSNSMSPTSLLFAKNGNLLIGEKHIVLGTQSAVAIQMVAKATVASACGYGLTACTAGNLYSIAGGGLLTQPSREIALGGLFNYSLTLDSTTPQGNLISTTNGSVTYLNYGSSTVTRYGQSLAHGAATTITGTPTGHGACTSGGGHIVSTGTSGPAILGTPAVTVDANNNVFVTDNSTGTNQGCTWLLPAAETASPVVIDGITTETTAGHYEIYNLTAPTGSTAVTSGSAAKSHYLATTDGIALDAAGNIVLGLGGSSDKGLWVIAEHNGTYWGTSMTKGAVYKVNATPSLTGVTSVVNGATGHVLLVDPTAIYNVTGGPTSPFTPATTTTLTESPQSGTAYVGTTVTFTAHVTPTSATGTVGFYVTGTLKSTQPLVSGTAHYTTNTLTAATYHVQAKFVSTTTATFTSSTSPLTTYVVTAATTRVTSVYQQLAETVKPGHLTLSCTSYAPATTAATPPAKTTRNLTEIRVCSLITLPQAKITGTQQTKSAPMNDLYINTARGTPTSGWSLSAIMVPSTTIPTTTHNSRDNDNANAWCDTIQGFCDSSIGRHALNSHGQIPASDLSLTGYECTHAATNHNPTPTLGHTTVTPPYTAHSTLATLQVLCSAAAGTSGGEFLVHAGTYTLTIPATVYKGLYYGTVQFTLVATA